MVSGNCQHPRYWKTCQNREGTKFQKKIVTATGWVQTFFFSDPSQSQSSPGKRTRWSQMCGLQDLRFGQHVVAPPGIPGIVPGIVGEEVIQSCIVAKVVQLLTTCQMTKCGPKMVTNSQLKWSKKKRLPPFKKSFFCKFCKISQILQ